MESDQNFPSHKQIHDCKVSYHWTVYMTDVGMDSLADICMNMAVKKNPWPLRATLANIYRSLNPVGIC
jgi:hypothetical protein